MSLAIAACDRAQPHGARPLHVRARQQRGSRAPVGRERRPLEDRDLQPGGAICGVAGLLIASRLNSAQPALGQGYELDAIAAVVIGGTSLSGGTGTILGTIIGAFIMSVLTNGLRILSVAQEWQIVVTGVIIILAVYADILRRKRALSESTRRIQGGRDRSKMRTPPPADQWRKTDRSNLEAEEMPC